MNTKAFSLGFTVVDSMVTGVANAAKSTAHGAKASVRATKNGVVNASEAVTSFFAGMHHAYRMRSGTCRILTVDME